MRCAIHLCDQASLPDSPANRCFCDVLVIGRLIIFCNISFKHNFYIIFKYSLVDFDSDLDF